MDATYRDKPDVHKDHTELEAAIESAKHHIEHGAESVKVTRYDEELDTTETEYIEVLRDLATAIRGLTVVLEARKEGDK